LPGIAVKFAPALDRGLLMHGAGAIAFALVVVIAGGVVHELIHGFFYALFAKNKFRSIKFGIKLKYGVAYCMCTELMKIKLANKVKTLKRYWKTYKFYDRVI
jgi:hypothetical protein